MDRQVRLNQYRYVNAGESNFSINIDLSNDKNSIRETRFNEELDLYNIYLDERESCNKIRLTAQVNLLASNVLFNSVTEIVKNEGSDECECLNFTPIPITSSYGKDSTYLWGSDIHTCVMDTQITSEFDDNKNYTYNCGIDIFTNHILRSKIQTPNCYSSNDLTFNFNTIGDYLRDSFGKKRISSAYNWENNGDKYMHLYQKEDIQDFTTSITENLIDRNGWLGFLNKSKMPSYDSNGNDMGISRVINNKPINNFIQMYPNSSHYALMPYYNKNRHRKEKNWEYSLLYPFSSTTENISCINPTLNTLKIGHIDENYTDYDDAQRTTIYSIAKHGLSNDDIINIYRTTADGVKSELIEENVIVDNVIDEYTFSVYLSDYICNNWISVFDDELIEGTFSSHVSGSDKYYYNGDSSFVKSFNNFINADFDDNPTSHIGSQNLSFCKIVNNEPCKYYVRIFSRFPNFDFCSSGQAKENIYSKDSTGQRIIDRYSSPDYEKQSVMNKLGFAKNIYGDDIVQIVYLDDISITDIKDNLGRPLTSLYLGFFKTNYGRKEWYNGNITSENVEHSHCFGKLTAGFKYSPYIDSETYSVGNINVMNNVDSNHGGLNQLLLRNEVYDTDSDEIVFKYQTYFYGDLCEYSENNCNERVLQPVLNRFNTQQRELKNSGLSMSSNFTSVLYDDITYDDYSSNMTDYQISIGLYDNTVTEKREGYYYISNYEIPIRTFSSEISEFVPNMFKIASIENSISNIYTIKLNKESYFNWDSNLCLYDVESFKEYSCKIINILSTNVISCQIYDGNNEVTLDLSNINLDNYRIYKKADSIPSYASVASDGSGKIRWREVIQNGFEDSEDIIEEYPFTNGCLYINKPINIFLRRQDPYNINGLMDNTDIDVLFGNMSETESQSDSSDDSISESSATC